MLKEASVDPLWLGQLQATSALRAITTREPTSATIRMSEV
jgi:hypothetical protein